MISQALSFSYFAFLITRNIFGFECEISANICETSLEIGHRLTMMTPKQSEVFPLTEEAVYPAGGQLYRYDVVNETEAVPVAIDSVISADGWETTKLVVVANGTMPGPPIIVYEGQTVKVHVTNRLKSEQVTIHWHGLPQKGSPYMDGVPFITQCPILTGQTFVYEFKAVHKGTYWYHSHMGSQRSKGLFGAFIIRENGEPKMGEHLMSIQDWNHDWDSDMDDAKIIFGPFENRKVNKHPWDIKIHSGLFNGRGRFWDPKSNKHNEAPLDIYNVQKGHQYRFRVVNTGTEYPWVISVDNHSFLIVATDGFDVEPQTADSILINVGERFDFILMADQEKSNYWIRGKSIENSDSHTAEAILRYQGAPEKDPESSPKTCTHDNKCLVINCFHRRYPEDIFTECLPVDELHLKSDSDLVPLLSENNAREVFLNFGFPGIDITYGAVNGRRFVFPTENVLGNPNGIHFPCEQEDCGEQKLCQCTNSLKLNHKETLQLTFLSMGRVHSFPHPIHLHGHTFYVLKIGFSTYDRKTGKLLEENFDIDCRGGTSRKRSYCNNATWRNSSWAGGNIPGLKLKKAVRKDTILVPRGGYVVTRIVADNPGIWLLHCHNEVHINDGMAVLINESFPFHQSPPIGFPRCHSYTANEQDLSVAVEETSKNAEHSGVICWKDTTVQVLIASLCGVLLLQLVILVICVVRSLRENGHNKYKVNVKPNPPFSVTGEQNRG